MKSILIICSLFLAFNLKAQDINFSQFYELPLLRNPALAGIYKGDLRATGTIRSQWGSVSAPYLTQALGAETRKSVSENSNNYFSFGIQVTNDIAGDSKLAKTQLFPLIAFHKSLSTEKDMYLTLAFMGGIVNQRFDPTDLKFDDQFVNGSYSPTNPTQQTFSNTSFMYMDGAVGMSFSNTTANDIKYYLGSAYFHFTEPKVAFNKDEDIKLNKKLVINAGMSVPTSDFDKLIFYADYFTQGGNKQGQGGLMYKHDFIQQGEEDAISLSAGAFLRWADAVMPVVKLDYYKFGVGFTYDVNISKLHTASNTRGGFEISLSFKSFLNINNSSANKTRCPVNVN